MQNKRPYNEQRQPHGLWENHSNIDDSFYRLHFVNGEIFGFLETYDGDVKVKNEEYHAR